MSSPEHVPVLAEEVMRFLKPEPGHKYIDATVGYAGHSYQILERSSPDGLLLGIDADRHAIDSARATLSSFAGRVQLFHSYFDDLPSIASGAEFIPADGILFDLGLSSPQLGDASRGFSFTSGGPLDMRMDTSLQITAADILNSAAEHELATIFHSYGEERYARRIAGQIVRERHLRPLATSHDLARIVSRSVPRPSRSVHRIHPATRVFQALRIAVNDELERLRRVLPESVDILRSGGRLVVITFHSLEDRIVKQFMQAHARSCICPPEAPKCTCSGRPRIRVLTKKPIVPTAEEVEQNPRSRSAKLRAAEAI